MMNANKESQDIQIKKLVLGTYSTNCYIIISQVTGDSVIIDAPAEPDIIIENLKDTHPCYILLTHGHKDHVGALAKLHSKLKIPLAAHAAEVGLPVIPEIRLNDGDKITFGDILLDVLYTPGHTPGSICFLHNKYLFSGDTIFPGGPGYTRSTSDFRQIITSIKDKIFVLPDDTEFLPGHGMSTSVKREKNKYTDFILRQRDSDLHGDVTWSS